MKYMITNGNQYIHIKPNTEETLVVDTLLLATKFKYQAAMDFIKNSLSGDVKWGLRRLDKASKSGKNYVITTGTNYVTNTSARGITDSYQKAKWFRSIADAEVYISKHNPFDENFIIGEDGEKADSNERKQFTDEQLRSLGITTTKTKRIIIPKTIKQRVYEKCHGRCGICGAPVTPGYWTLDHIMPLARGGSNEINNLQVACDDCNKLKSSRTDEEFATGLTTILSHSLSENPNKELSDMLIRTIVRGTINQMFQGTIYSTQGEQ